MTHNEKAAIVGYHLSGATIEHIIAITGCYWWEIEKIINDYTVKKEDDPKEIKRTS